MIKEIVLNTKKTEEICTEILSLWSENENKVIVIRNKTKINDVKLFYENHDRMTERYSEDYVRDENYAKENKLGMWKGSFTRPEKWRKLN